MIPSNAPDTYCADLSQALGEPLSGTATRADTWFLLSYDGPWNAKATDDNDLPRPVQAWLAAQTAAVPHSRVQFIRQSPAGAEPVFFVARAGETPPALYRFPLTGYADLLHLDTAAILAGDPAGAAYRQPGPLYLVCTNGKRDRCCARYGVALCQALSQLAGPAVWQTTHLGGHRFAPTLLTLPDSRLYGRLTPAGAAEFVQARQQGQVSLPHLRGCTAYEPVVQAAEVLLRQATGELAVDAFRLVSVGAPAGALWPVTFYHRPTGRTHHLHLRQMALQLPVLASCGKPESKPLYQYELARHRSDQSPILNPG